MTWEIKDLHQFLASHSGWLVSEEDGCICVTNEDGLDAYVAVSGQQIIVESVLFSKNQVSNTQSLNEEILKTHQIFPLTTVGLTSINNEDYYIAFGALSSQSKEESIRIEVETLFENVAVFLDAYEEFLA